MIKINSLFYILFFSIYISNVSLAQNSSDLNNNIDSDTTSTDSLLPKTNTFKVLFSGKPGRAAFYSLVIPSGGQIYNRKWWKVPIALGIDGWFTYKYLQHRSDFNLYDKKYKDHLNGMGDPNIPIATAKTMRENSRRLKEYGLVYAIVGHLVTVFDAYVDRHLMDFDSSDDVSFAPIQNYDNTLTLISIRIPLN